MECDRKGDGMKKMGWPFRFNDKPRHKEGGEGRGEKVGVGVDVLLSNTNFPSLVPSLH